jgi:hypothetical protein
MASYLIVYLSHSIKSAVSNIFGIGPAPQAAIDTSPTTRCFRISDIPSTWSEDCLVKVMKSTDPGFDEGMAKISLYPSCNGTGKTALLYLSERSELVQHLQTEKTTYLSEDPPINIVIDSNFYDLTPLNTPKSPIIAE